LIVGAHSVISSRDPDADRAFLRDVLGLPHVDAGGGWLIFGLPPAEVAVHPSEKNDVHEFYLLCDDVEAFVGEMKGRGVECTEVLSLGWGLLTRVALPGGGRVGVYQPRHARPKAPRKRAAARRKTTRRAKTARKASRRTPRKTRSRRR
jgi:catechol 2,3-dioxygenase-like lactoylglutathione lyase family enzyme